MLGQPLQSPRAQPRNLLWLLLLLISSSSLKTPFSFHSQCPFGWLSSLFPRPMHFPANLLSSSGSAPPSNPCAATRKTSYSTELTCPFLISWGLYESLEYIPPGSQARNYISNSTLFVLLFGICLISWEKSVHHHLYIFMCVCMHACVCVCVCVCSVMFNSLWLHAL